MHWISVRFYEIGDTIMSENGLEGYYIFIKRFETYLFTLIGRNFDTVRFIIPYIYSVNMLTE